MKTFAISASRGPNTEKVPPVNRLGTSNGLPKYALNTRQVRGGGANREGGLPYLVWQPSRMRSWMNAASWAVRLSSHRRIRNHIARVRV
jgi:hypothetical protein